MADVEITCKEIVLAVFHIVYSLFAVPNNKKVKVPSGSSLKDAAKKAGFTPNYGCEEGRSNTITLQF